MTSDPKLDAYLTQLAASHKFTLEQLAANRAGRIHPEQLARRRRSGIRWVIVLIVLSVLVGVAGVAGAIMAYDLPMPPSGVDRAGFFQLTGGGLVVAAALLIAALVKGMNVRRMLGRSDVSMVEGPLHKSHLGGSGGDVHAYHIGNRKFDFIPRDAWHLVTNGMQYRVYFRDKELLSLEPSGRPGSR